MNNITLLLKLTAISEKVPTLSLTQFELLILMLKSPIAMILSF